MKIITANSKNASYDRKKYLQGSLLVVIWRRVSTLVNMNLVDTNLLGNFIAHKISDDNKIL